MQDNQSETSLEQEAADENTPGDRFWELAKISIQLAQLVASNSSAPPELLQELAKSSDIYIRKNIAANPNAPTEVLLKLGAEFPAQLINNPIFALWLLENPNFPAVIPLPTLRSLVTQENVPESFFVECANRQADRELLLELTIKPKLSTNVLEKLTQSKYTEVAEAAKLHVNYSGEMSEGWDEVVQEKIQAIIPRDNTSLRILALQGLIPNFLILHWQKNDYCGQKVFEEAVKSNKNSSRVLERLSDDEKIQIRVLIAANPSTPVTSWEHQLQNLNTMYATAYTSLEKQYLIHSYEHGFRHLLKGYAESSCQLVRLIALLHPQALEDVLTEKSRSLVWLERYAVAQNPSTPTDTLNTLANDGNRVVRAAAKANLQNPWQ